MNGFEMEMTKQCKYPNCENVLLADSEFDQCERCRTLSVRNAQTILLDPRSPINDREAEITGRMFHNMTPEEKINYVAKLERHYLEVRKHVNGMEVSRHRAAKFEEALKDQSTKRAAPKAPKLVKQKETRQQKLEKMLGKDGARELLSEQEEFESLL